MRKRLPCLAVLGDFKATTIIRQREQRAVLDLVEETFEARF